MDKIFIQGNEHDVILGLFHIVVNGLVDSYYYQFI